MKVLVDTHLLLWAAEDVKLVPRKARALMKDRENELLFSVASLWEIVIKRGLNRIDFQVNPHMLRRQLIDNGYRELPIRSEHAVAVEALPPIHKDPVDRMLIAQATVEGFTLLTDDAIVARYPGPVQLT